MFINRPGRKFQSAQGNSYIKVPVGGKIQIVILDAEVLSQWDSLLTIEVAEQTYEKSMVDGKLVDVPFSRYEITDFTTTTRDISLVEHEIKMSNLRKGVVSAPLTSAQVALAAEAI